MISLMSSDVLIWYITNVTISLLIMIMIMVFMSITIHAECIAFIICYVSSIFFLLQIFPFFPIFKKIIYYKFTSGYIVWFTWFTLLSSPSSSVIVKISKRWFQFIWNSSVLLFISIVLSCLKKSFLPSWIFHLIQFSDCKLFYFGSRDF